MGISLVKVYKRAWKSVFPTVKRLKRAVKKSRRFPSILIFKTVHIKGTSSQLGM